MPEPRYVCESTAGVTSECEATIRRFEGHRSDAEGRAEVMVREELEDLLDMVVAQILGHSYSIWLSRVFFGHSLVLAKITKGSSWQYKERNEKEI